MLDEFVPSKPEPTTVSAPGRPVVEAAATTDSTASEGITDNDFARQLQAGMADMMKELDSNPDMALQLENMLKELGNAANTEEAAGFPPSVASVKGSSTKAGPASGAAEESFQETIKKTMERMQASGDNATAAATSENTDDILAEMMKAMAAGGMDGASSEEDFSKMLLGMMEQLTNKEILYEPMKELDDKFPAWMETHAEKTAEEDLKRYKEQQVYVKEIVDRFEMTGYSDDNVKDREYIVERMQKVNHLFFYDFVTWFWH